MLGYFPIGFAFGVLASSAGLDLSGAMAMSVFVYAGSSQLIAVGLIEGGAGLLTLTFTVFLVNLRHMLMSAYLAPYLGRLKRWQQACFCYELTDESFAVHSADLRKAGAPPAAQLFALKVRWLSYIPVAVLAALLGPALLAPEGRLSLEFAGNPGFWVSIPIFLIAIFTRNLFITVLSGMCAIALWRLLL